MTIRLADLTTFHIGGPVREFVEIDSREAAEKFFFEVSADPARGPIFVLGGGSNILASDRGYDGVVAHLQLRGIAIERETRENVWLRVSAGESWDGVVARAVESGWWGIENLSHIPGLAGALAVQNVGAYGQEAGQVVESVEVWDLHGGQRLELTAAECLFGYRRSIFNSSGIGRYAVLSVLLRLSKISRPNLDYADLQKYFAEQSNLRPSQAEIRAAIIAIRDRKFPYPVDAATGNAGSFFKNPTLTAREYERLRERLGIEFGHEARERLDRGARPAAEGLKLSAALLVDLCGLKGRRSGGAVVHDAQPLVIRNTGSAIAADVIALAATVRRTVHHQTGVALDTEPVLLGFLPEEIEEFRRLE